MQKKNKPKRILFASLRLLVVTIFAVLVNAVAILVCAVPIFLVLCLMHFVISFFVAVPSFGSGVIQTVALVSIGVSTVYMILHYVYGNFGGMSKKKMKREWDKKIKEPLEEAFKE